MSAGKPEFYTHRRQVWKYVSITPVLEGQDGQIPEVPWPASLAKLTNSGFSGRPCHRNKVVKVQETSQKWRQRQGHRMGRSAAGSCLLDSTLGFTLVNSLQHRIYIRPSQPKTDAVEGGALQAPPLLRNVGSR